MEWAEMHRPLEPPPGYEKYATLRASSPGLESVPPITSWSHFRDVLRAAWKMYKHSYFPDPEIIAKEEEERKEEERLKKLERAKRKRVQKKLRREGEEVLGIVHDSLPDSQKAIEERLDILNVSLEEFISGYRETSSGATTLFGATRYNEDAVRPENAPVVYRVSDY